MRFRIGAIVIAVLTTLCWLMPLHAQDNEGVARIVHIMPKAGHDESLITGITEYHKWVANFEGHMRYDWFEVLTGPYTGTYFARTGDHNWSDFDAKYDWQEESEKVLNSNVMPHVKKLTAMMTRDMIDFTHWPENMEGFSHYVVEQWYVKPGHMGKFRRHLKQIVTALKENGYPGYFSFYSVASGGQGGQIGVVSPQKGWSDMSDEDPSFVKIMSDKLGGMEAFDAFMMEFGTTFKTGENMMLRYMAGASDYGE